MAKIKKNKLAKAEEAKKTEKVVSAQVYSRNSFQINCKILKLLFVAPKENLKAKGSKGRERSSFHQELAPWILRGTIEEIFQTIWRSDSSSIGQIQENWRK